ncbi:MAG: transcription-repair coupling factor [Pirellulaceae bacterium]
MATVTPHARAAEELRDLAQQLKQNDDFLELTRRLRMGEATSIDEAWGSSCALTIAALASEDDPVLVITSNLKVQDDLFDDLESFRPESRQKLPACSVGVESSVIVDQEYGDRLRLLKNILEQKQPRILVCSVQSVLQPVPSAKSIETHSRILRVNEQLDVESFADWLTTHGFHKTTAVELPGEFSVRGGIVDIYAPDWLKPVRIELFDDEIESLRQFEIATQRSIANVAQIEITVLSPDYKDKSSVFDFISPRTQVVLHEPQTIRTEAEAYLERSGKHNEFFEWAEVQRLAAKHPLVSVERLSAGRLDNHFSLQAETLGEFGNDFSELRAAVDRAAANSICHVVARVEGEIERVTEILSSTQSARDGRMRYSVGCIHESFRLRGSNHVIIGCDQLFHRGELRRSANRRRTQGKVIDSFLSLRDGDLIVHLSHGIGRFRGLQMLQKDGQFTEHLELEFYGGTRIFVPAAKIDLVQKYVGASKHRPVLSKIGGKSWLKQKQAAEEAVTDLAAEMLELQAERSSRPGIAMNDDTAWQMEFEHAFPYRETPDQISAIKAIKKDMETPRPMDRLLCGDVGFGKTEVAMRAAFKAVENGYQVGVLVPTTVLAEQHYRTFKERMSEFPIEIGKLSRFSSKEEQKKTLAGLKQGRVDICIGTHRIVSKDVKFNNLGLVIIDEEQRFGVAHKERLKTLRNEVDVLTMSATPIPRTLHLSLVGVRDISNLETPPEERSAVETRVTRFNNELIRTAIIRELNRGGQIYFVHNRVNDIHIVKQKIESIVPEASVVVGHGQMEDEELEGVMTDFVLGKYDVLLATTIIESGLDIPNANTIFIDEANRYGLSDLHQLRGRVGRYKHQAYCYLLLNPDKPITPNAAKRLQAIETFSEMGAGFSISMRDLEIRGAGNLLGTEQSGHISAVGYELYCQLLETAVRKLKKMPAKLSMHVDIDLPIEAHLPAEYVGSGREKIDLYRRLTRCEDFAPQKAFEKK